jgi:glycolate oxidase FAD binding subunit
LCAVPPLNGSTLARDFAALVGDDRVRAAHGREAEFTSVVVEPEQTDEIGAVVRKCEQDRITLAPVGSARTVAQMRRAPVGIAVSLARMNRVVAYDPADMTIIAEGGVMLGAVNRMTAAHGQRLPSDPAQPELTTIGALIAGAKAGPLRLSEGTIRDLLIGIRFVGHDGRPVHAGGRVVKNVAGYDLMKVLTGSFGTLGIITEAAFKVRPIPPNYQLALATFTNSDEAFVAAAKAAETAPLLHCDVLSPGLAATLDDAGNFAVLAGFAGVRAEVEYQAKIVVDALGKTARILADVDAATAYERLRDRSPDAPVVAAQLAAQLAVLPAELARCVAATGADFRAHAASGVAQLYHSGPSEQALAAIATWREFARAARGHLRVIAAHPDLRAKFAMFDTPPPPALGLMRRMKVAFDPHGVFNPGCFVGGL